jgi:AraC-like DNA-binding protein
VEDLAKIALELKRAIAARASVGGAERPVSRMLAQGDGWTVEDVVEDSPDSGLTLRRLAQEAGLSPYHFLWTFERLTGLTPHPYVIRARLREAAIRLATERAGALDVALDCGFGDLSNFYRAFRGIRG